jgi:hypothetical protein
VVKVNWRRSKRNKVKLDGVAPKIVEVILEKTKLKTRKPTLKKAMVHQQNPKQSRLNSKLPLDQGLVKGFLIIHYFTILFLRPLKS